VIALRFSNVEKRYGKTVALAGLDLEVPAGSVLGLVGPNGAGKTTAFGIASGAVRPDGGEIDVLGQGPFDAAKHRGRVSVVPQDSELNPHSSARALLFFFACLQGMTSAAARREAERLLEIVRLSDRADTLVRKLSHGMRRRLAVAQALIGEPELVLLDEPTGGLDPHLVVEMRELLRAQRGKRTIVVSTHILSDIETTCDRVAFLEAGRVVKSGPLDEVLRRGGLVRVRVAEPPDLGTLADVFGGREPRIEGGELVFTLREGEDPPTANAELLPALIERGVKVIEVRLGDSLEAAYLASRDEKLTSTT
jgi:ABC-type multidrug transport system ATPase subunit